VEGVWGNARAGNVYQIEGSVLRQFELTSETCVLGFVAEQRPPSLRGSEVLFVSAGKARFSIRHGMDADHKILASPNGSSEQVLTRLRRLPRVCTPPTPDTPSGNFEVFTHTFAERYTGLEPRNVDWPAMVSSARSQLSGATNPAKLFDVFEELLAPLHDLHTSLSAPDLKRSTSEFWRAGPADVIASGSRSLDGRGIAALFRPTGQAYPNLLLRSFCNGQLQYGRLDDGIGYLRILSFDDYSTTEESRRAMNRALDEILADRTLRGLVIDVRVNLGGDDRLGLAMASRLTEHPYPAYRVEARLPGGHWQTSEADLAAVAPAPPVFSGPVAALISPLTMSAGEIFALALMGRTPHVTTIGESTQGLLGGVLGRHLPNGWIFGLPNTRVVSPDGRSFEAKGLSPEIEVPAFSDGSDSKGGDRAIAAALHVLKDQIYGSSRRVGERKVQ
jgi:hypothetical protein